MKGKNEILTMMEDGFLQNHQEIESKKGRREAIIKEVAKKYLQWIFEGCRELNEDKEFKIIIKKELNVCNDVVTINIVPLWTKKNVPYPCQDDEPAELVIEAMKYIQESSKQSEWISIENIEEKEAIYALLVKIRWENKD